MYITHFEPTINGRKYVIYCISENTRNGFCHKAIMGDRFKKVDYYNRTWESFQFETVLRRLIEDIWSEDGVDYSKSKRGRKIKLIPKNIDEIIRKINKKDPSNTDIVYDDPKIEEVLN